MWFFLKSKQECVLLTMVYHYLSHFLWYLLVRDALDTHPWRNSKMYSMFLNRCYFPHRINNTSFRFFTHILFITTNAIIINSQHSEILNERYLTLLKLFFIIYLLYRTLNHILTYFLLYFIQPTFNLLWEVLKLSFDFLDVLFVERVFVYGGLLEAFLALVGAETAGVMFLV